MKVDISRTRKMLTTKTFKTDIDKALWTLLALNEDFSRAKSRKQTETTVWLELMNSYKETMLVTETKKLLNYTHIDLRNMYSIDVDLGKYLNAFTATEVERV